MNVSSLTHRYSFVRVSQNKKTGPIPVSSTDRGSCPDECSYKDSGCFGENAPLVFHWNKLNHTGLTLDELCTRYEDLPRRQLARHNVVGDLPKREDGLINVDALERITAAASRIDLFAYTHFSPYEYVNHDAILAANRSGFTINLSCESYDEADNYIDMGIGPVVLSVPRGTPKVTHTKKGRQVTLCPADYSPMTCDRCGICAVSERKSVIAFTAHGSRAAKVERIFWAKAA
jgi:hypothetical protein